MATISSSDLMMGTATMRGRTIANFSSDGFSSIDDIIAAVRRSAVDISGVVELNLRNASQGWRQRCSVFFD